MYNEAINCFDRAIQLDSKFANAYFNKGFSLDAIGKFKEAIDCYDKVIELNPNDADAFKNNGGIGGWFAGNHS